MKRISTYLFSIITFACLPIFIKPSFWQTIKKDLNPFQLFLADQEGSIFHRLPDQAKKSGKHILISMPACKSDTIIQIIHPGIDQIGKNSISQVITLTPKDKSKIIQIPKPFDDQHQTLLVEIRKKTNAYTDYIQFLKNHTLENLSPEEKTEFFTLQKDYNENPKNLIQLNYATLHNNQKVTLPYPAKNKPTVNYLNDKIIANFDGAIFNALPNSIKQSGKRITLSLPDDCGKDICVTIRQSIKARPDLGLVAQVVNFTKKTPEKTVYLPEVPTSQDIMMTTAANKDVKNFNKNFRKYHNKMHTLSNEQRKTIFKEFPENFNNYKYAELKNDQIIKLSCPTKTFLQQL